MPTSTYNLINSTTLVSSSTGITFSGIDQTYRDLRVTFEFPAILAGQYSVNVYIRLNGSTTAYKWVYMRGNGSAMASYAQSDQQFRANASTYTETDRYTGVFDFFDYSTNKYKSVLTRGAGFGTVDISSYAGLWSNTSAVTSIEIFTNTYTFPPGTKANLYGIVG